MKKLVLALVALTTIASPLALASSADAAVVKHPHQHKHHAKKHHTKKVKPKAKPSGSPQCVTMAEWRAIKPGMSRAQVTRLTGIPGVYDYDYTYDNGWQKETNINYRQCRPNGTPSSDSWDNIYVTYYNYVTRPNPDDYNWPTDYPAPTHVEYKGGWVSVSS